MGGGDFGLMDALEQEWQKPNSADMRSSLQRSVESHAMGFAAEVARVEKRVINLRAYRTEV